MDNINLEEAVKSFYKKLIDNNKDYLILFSNLQIQIEGWFRGEIMHYFKENRYDMTTKNREVPVTNEERKKVDLKVKLNNVSYWIELKHLLVGYQKGNKKEGNQYGNYFSLNFYFYSGTYISNDIEKLKKVSWVPKETTYKYVLAFLSTNYPEDKEIKNGKITSKEILEEQVKSILKSERKDGPLINRACLIADDFNEDCNFGYFLLKVIV